MTESPKYNPPSNPNKNLDSLNYRTRLSINEQLDTSENFKEKLKLLRLVLDDIRKYCGHIEEGHRGERGGSTSDLDIVFKNFDLVSETISDLKNSKAVVTKNEITEFKILEKNRNDLLLYLNKKTITVKTVGAGFNDRGHYEQIK